MPAFIDLTGIRFGRLVVVERAPNAGKRTNWLCHCDCGRAKIVGAEGLKNGRILSCTCLSKEKTAAINYKHGFSKKIPEYHVWNDIKDRCDNPLKRCYKNYGGRGITVCERWRKDFISFYEDMGPRPTNEHSIDRINNDGNYEPSNCRWATRIEQANNTRANKKYAKDGKSQTIKQWARELGVDVTTIYWRLNHGQSLEQALTRNQQRKAS